MHRTRFNIVNGQILKNNQPSGHTVRYPQHDSLLKREKQYEREIEQSKARKGRKNEKTC